MENPDGLGELTIARMTIESDSVSFDFEGRVEGYGSVFASHTFTYVDTERSRGRVVGEAQAPHSSALPPNAFSRSPTRTCVSQYAKGLASTWRLALLVATFPAVATCAVGHCVGVRMHIAVVGLRLA